jgi:5-carboxymethyl-2-hydroxymuconate isomerase
MPFITIEIPEKFTFALSPFASQIHEYLYEYLDIPIEKLKSKVERLSEVFVGYGGASAAYAHLKVELLEGRDKEKLALAANVLLAHFKEAIEKQNPGVRCRITVEFREIDPELLVAVQI